MKISTLIFSFLVMAFTASAQFVIVNSPASIAGSKSFTAASFGADLTSGIWTGDVVFVDDGSANPNQGCNPAINGADIAGKIALVDRGSCEFGIKCLNAENAGAIAVIVFNNAAGAGTIAMGAGANGDAVTIPAVMLSYEDGQAFRAELANGAVNVTIGAVKFTYDLGSDLQNVMNAPLGVIPADQAEASLFSITPAAIIKNKGLTDATNVALNAVIDFTELASGAVTQVYDETGSLATLAVDSSDLIELAEYVPAEGIGTYDVTYTISSDNPDNPEVTGDNEVGSRFFLSENIFCKGGWDFANNRPGRTNAYTISGGGNIEFLSAFSMPKSKGYSLDSIHVYMATGLDSFALIEPGSINGYVYQWIDANADGGITNSELAFIGFAEVDFNDPAFRASNGLWLTLPIVETVDFSDPLVLDEDDVKLIVGVRYQGAELVYFGFDENYDQTVYTNYLAQSDFDLPYVGINAWDNLVPNIESGFLFTGFRGAVSTALYVTAPEPSSSVEKAPITTSVSLSPNPAANLLNVETELVNNTKTIEYTIRDIAGRRVLSVERNVNGTFDKAQFNVSSLPSGQYFLNLRTKDGSTSSKFTVTR